jgi:nitrate/nitrite transport system permease protein
MSLPAVKISGASPPGAAKVLAFRTPRPDLWGSRIVPLLREAAVRAVPPTVVIALVALVWELLCSRPGASLPPRS